jgi:hypothetical protein
MHAALIALALTLPGQQDPGPLVRALWLVQRYGTAEAASPVNDQRTKGMLARALGKDGVLTASEVAGLIDPATFAKLAGPDGRLEPAEIQRAMESTTPESRKRLPSPVLAHANYLTTTFDLIDEPHRQAGEKLAEWIAANYRRGQPLHVTVVCTGNTRRSVLGATMGNIAAAYYGMPEVRFHSGGTAPAAVNSRTVAALKAIGVEIDPTGTEAPRGEPATANPVYRIRWGDDSAMETAEFSKMYADPSNPQSGFAALMVCSEADAACPFVKGAALRVSMPYLDPKIFDGGAYESAKYAERRDDMGRLMLAVLMQAGRRCGSGSERSTR